MTALARVALPWRMFLAGALLALALAAALAERPLGTGPVPLGAAHAPARLARVSSGGGLVALPPGARAVASAALGAARAGYQAGRSGRAFTARNAPQGFAARFSTAGVTLGAGALTVGLHLRAVGYGSSPGGVGRARPRARSNRVVYRRAGLSEWYANGPLGLEQGFTLDARPHGPRATPLTLLLSLSGNATATRAADGRSLTLAHGGASLRYGSLLATDASGRAMHSWLELHGRNLLLRVDARGARYPLRIDPLVQQGGKLVGGGEEGAGAFGVKVALSTDGNTALVGGFGDNGETGAAWVFTRTGSTWTQQGPKLTATDEVGAGEFGTSVALSSDGNTAVIGGPTDDNGAKEQLGAAWVFVRSGSTWHQQGPKLLAEKGEESEKGQF
ncbi:MAG TPA: FG-GAP repeat protein, partial [Solirubrobacteraceae bacterium]